MEYDIFSSVCNLSYPMVLVVSKIAFIDVLVSHELFSLASKVI